MIAKVFLDKRRRQIQRKFHKERKRNPERIETALNLHRGNQIKKQPSKNLSFCEHLFARTDTSEDEMGGRSFEQRLEGIERLFTKQETKCQPAAVGPLAREVRYIGFVEILFTAGGINE